MIQKEWTRSLLICCLVLIWTAPLAAQRKELAGLLKSVADGNETLLARGLARHRAQLFDLLATGFRVQTGTTRVDPLIAHLTPDLGQAGLRQLALRYTALDPTQRSRWSATLRSILGLEGQLLARKAKKKELQTHLARIRANLPKIAEPWLKGRSTLALRLAAWLGKARVPEAEQVLAAVPAMRTLQDDTGLGLALLARSQLLATRLEAVSARQSLDEAQARLKGAHVASDGRVDLLLGHALLSLSQTYVRYGEDSAAASLFKQARTLLKSADRSDLRTLDLLQSVVLARAGTSRKALSLVKRTLNGILKQRDAQLLTQHARLALLVLRLVADHKSAISFARKARKAYKALGGDALGALPLRYEEALSLLATKQGQKDGISQLRIIQKVAQSIKRPHLARLALERLALFEARRGSKEAWKPYVAELAQNSLGDGQLDRLQAAAFQAHLAVALAGSEQMAAAASSLVAAHQVAEELGLLVDDLPQARPLRVPGNSTSLERQLLEVLPYHPTSARTKSLAYGLLERHRLMALAKGLPPLAKKGDLAHRLDQSRMALRRLFLSWDMGGRPASTTRAQAVVSERRELVATCRKTRPQLALRRFPKAAPIQIASRVSQRQRATFLYLYVGQKGSMALAMGGGYWNFIGIPPAAKLAENLKIVREVLQGKHDRTKFIVAAGELHRWLITPLLGTLQNRKRVFVISDPALSGLNLGLLVPEGTGSMKWSALPFLLREWSFAEIPAVSLLTRLRDVHGRRAWSTSRRMAVVGAVGGDHLLGPLQLFDDQITAEQARSHASLRLVQSPDLASTVAAGGPLEGMFRSGGFLHVGAGVQLDQKALARAPHFRPEAMVLEELPGTSKERDDFLLRMLRQGVDLVLAGRPGTAPKGLHEILTRRFWRGLVRDGFGPGRALSEAWRAFLLGNLPVNGAAPTDKLMNPSQWANFQLMVRRL